MKMRYKRDITRNEAERMIAAHERAKAKNPAHRQRKVKPARVTKYATKMLRGEWKWGISNIAVLSDGFVINGLHTLYAIVESGVTVTMDVWENCSPEEFAAYDSPGSSRTLAEIFEIASLGTDVEAKFSSLTAKINSYLAGTLPNFNPKSMTEEGILATAYEYTEEITEAFDFASAATLRAELVALLYFVAQHEGMLTTEVKSFLKGFATGANLSEESMALRFRAYCTAQGRNLRGKKATKVFFNAVNAVLQGRDIKLFGSVKGVKLVLEPAKPKTRKRKAAAVGR